MKSINSWRLKQMLSYYNAVFAFSLVLAKHSGYIQHNFYYDVIAALAIVVALSVMAYYIRFGVSTIKPFYTELFGVEVPKWLAFLIDILIHFFPALLIGVPTNGLAFIPAICIVVLWYLYVRQDFVILYGIQFGEYIDYVISKVMPMSCIMILLYGMWNSKYAFHLNKK